MNHLTRLLLRVRYSAVAPRIEAWAKHRDRGATAVEYGLLVALIAVGIIGAMTALGDEIQKVFTDIKNQLQASNSPS